MDDEQKLQIKLIRKVFYEILIQWKLNVFNQNFIGMWIEISP